MIDGRLEFFAINLINNFFPDEAKKISIKMLHDFIKDFQERHEK
jgi:hypothetical protein